MRPLLFASMLICLACASNSGSAGAPRPAANASDSAAATIHDTLDAAGTINQMQGDTLPDTTSVQPDTTTSR
ncbi:MAG: hypothetical protein H0W67_07675 [Gemmatimonadales bacterium]|nr:hypothetical protein [Gemmatimonadales bacterium]